MAGDRQEYGATMGQALDALTADWGEEVRESLILIQRFEPDAYYTEEQQQRKQDLLARRTMLTPDERAELERLLDAELDATIARTNRSLY